MFRIIMTTVFLCISIPTFAEQNYPVDMCYLVADLKYSKEKGVKICEIQHANLSAFKGDIYRNEVDASIQDELVRVLALYNKQGWVVNDGIADKAICKALAVSAGWQSYKKIDDLLLDGKFESTANQPVENEYDIGSYQGFLYANGGEICKIADYAKRFPAMVVIDKSSFPFWIDKFKMTQLFEDDAVLSSFKPRWASYKKVYRPDLAAEIAETLKCETFVIKPRGEFLGKGVIIAHKEELDDVLYYIITKKGEFAQMRDIAYSTWKKDHFDSFIVEEFIPSDLIAVPHLENKVYQPTMRVAFLLVYNNRSHHVHQLGGYWKLPALSIDEKGSFMAKNKDICKLPFYSAVDTEIMEFVKKELSIALPLLHQKMMQYPIDFKERS